MWESHCCNDTSRLSGTLLFSRPVADFIVYGEVHSPENLECIPDREIQEKLKKVCTPDHYWVGGGGGEKESISTKDNTALLLHKLNIFTLILYVHT